VEHSLPKPPPSEVAHFLPNEVAHSLPEVAHSLPEVAHSLPNTK
jgi:hypothetical protein